jgi:hypothetical protein
LRAIADAGRSVRCRGDAWKAIESLIEGEIRFRKLGPID